MASILSRKRDLAYLVYFLIHIPVIFCVDIVSLYPVSMRPTFINDLRTFYISTYHDRFFTAPPAWFGLYQWMELLYHAPLSLWAVGALLRDDPKLPIHLLIYAMQTAITTATCIADYLSWEDFTASEKIELGKLYGPYLALAVFMAIDMYSRLDYVIGQPRSVPQEKKRI